MLRRLVWSALAGLMAGVVHADGPPRQVDVTLQHETLCGQVVNSAGLALPTTRIALRSAAGGLLQQTRTDGRGMFAFPAVRPGVYQIVVADQRLVVRVWRSSLAPPTAGGSMLLAVGPASRGNGPLRHGAAKVANSLGGAGGVGVAVVGATMATVIVTSQSNSTGS